MRRRNPRAALRHARYTLQVTHISGTTGERRFDDGDAAWAFGLGLLDDPEGAGVMLKDKGRIVKFAWATKVLDKIPEAVRDKGHRIPQGMEWTA